MFNTRYANVAPYAIQPQMAMPRAPQAPIYPQRPAAPQIYYPQAPYYSAGGYPNINYGLADDLMTDEELNKIITEEVNKQIETINYNTYLSDIVQGKFGNITNDIKAKARAAATESVTRICVDGGKKKVKLEVKKYLPYAAVGAGLIALYVMSQKSKPKRRR